LFDCSNIFVALKKLPINFIQNTSVKNLRLGAIFFQKMINLSKETAQDSKKLLWKEKKYFSSLKNELFSLFTKFTKYKLNIDSKNSWAT
jgi:hypothetical protein